MKLTICTPTYNRANYIERTFESLEKQTEKSFQWIVVDDGSTDNTKQLVEVFQQNASFPISYIYQPNQGKHVAVNNGLDHTETEYFFCIDSDDWLLEDAVEHVLEKITDQIEPNSTSAIVMQCLSEDGQRLTSADFPADGWRGSIHDLIYNMGITGDTAIILRMEYMEKERFPQFPGEKFVPEALLYNRLAKKAPFVFYNTPIKSVEYLETGFSANMGKLFAANPMGYYTYINEVLNNEQLNIVQTIRHVAAVGVFGRKIGKSNSDVLKGLNKRTHRLLYQSMFPVILMYKLK